MFALLCIPVQIYILPYLYIIWIFCSLCSIHVYWTSTLFIVILFQPVSLSQHFVNGDGSYFQLHVTFWLRIYRHPTSTYDICGLWQLSLKQTSDEVYCWIDQLFSSMQYTLLKRPLKRLWYIKWLKRKLYRGRYHYICAWSYKSIEM